MPGTDTPNAAAAPTVPSEIPAAPAPSEFGRAATSEGAAAAPATVEEIEAAVLTLVADKTGYPPDMLDLDLDLEADLGVDTVKQAEIFATIRESYGIPRDENLKLRDFPTLAHVIGFVRERSAMRAEAHTNQESKAEPLTEPATLKAADSIPRRVPISLLRPPFEVCKPTGATIGPGSRLVIVCDEGGIADALVREVAELGATPLVIADAPEADALVERLQAWAAEGPIQGVYWLPAADPEPPIAAMDLATWREGLRRRVKLLFVTMKVLHDQLDDTGSFLVAGTRLGGLHGYDPAAAAAPMGGAVTGFLKAYKRERPNVVVKAVDFESQIEPPEAAAILIRETLTDPGAIEVGHRDGLRWAVGLEERSAADGAPGMVLSKDTVFVVTGAAGSIVSAIVSDLAATGGRFHLLDLAPEPDPADPDLARYATDRDGLKRELFERIKAEGERATPAMVDRRLAALERSQAAVAAMEAVRRSGGTVRYHQVDLRDADAVESAIDAVRAQQGRIDVLLHAAGLEISHLLPDKTAEEFDLVFDVKADGWFNLLHAIGDTPLGATVAFSSVAGRFGNAGQTDYSAANDLLCKSTSNLRTARPDTRGIVVDWTAWDRIGMASRGSIPKMMEIAGIQMLPPEAGIPVIRRELLAGCTRGEVVIAGRLGTIAEEWDETGGLDLDIAPALEDAPMIGRIAGFGVYDGLLVETLLDPAEEPFLNDHRMDGTPILPGVMGIEAFAELARLPLPGWHVRSVEDVEFLAPFKFYRDEPRTLVLRARFHPHGGEVLAECTLVGTRMLPNRPEPQATEHFRGVVRLGRSALAPATAPPPAAGSGPAVGAEDIYRVYFHGPSFRVLETAWPEPHGALGLLPEIMPPAFGRRDAATILDPRLVELCFQTAGIWDLGVRGRFGLPQHVGRVRFADPAPPRGRVYSEATAGSDVGCFDARVVDEAGNVLVSLEGYRTIELPGAIPIELLAALQPIMA
jgi:NAD(P)-dependent dehydrogenase (short-subunit alcohol dehydrogenase family)